ASGGRQGLLLQIVSWSRAARGPRHVRGSARGAGEEILRAADELDVAGLDVRRGHRRDLGGELLDGVELAGGLAAGLEGAGPGTVEQGRGDGPLDHVAGDHHEGRSEEHTSELQSRFDLV